MDENEIHRRLSRPEAERTDPNREFYGVWQQEGGQDVYNADEEIIATGRKTAAARSPGDIAAEAVANGYDMVDEFLKHEGEQDPSGIDGAGANALGASGLDDLQGILGGGITNTIGHVFTQYLQMWNEIFDRLLQSGDGDPFSAFSEITGVQAGGRERPESAGNIVVLANRPINVDVHWNSNIPEADLEVENLQPLGHRKRMPKGFEISVRRSVDGRSHVFDVSVPESTKSGRFAGIVTSEEGLDWGYITLSIQEE